MTTEIAVLNKSAVALAADSAMTITGDSGSAKIYNTANKIFEISKTQPLGVMIYGTPNYMGLPLEVLVKRFRNEFLDGKIFNNVSECAESFVTYLENDVPYDEEHENENVGRIISSTLQAISKKSYDLLLSYILEVGNFRRSKENGICQIVIRKEIDRLSTIGEAECFTPGQLNTIDRKYHSFVEEQIDIHFRWLTTKLTKETRRLLRRLVRLALHRSELSRFGTGIVVAGFGNKEICPTLCSFEMDGIVNGEFKKTNLELVDIDRNGPGADIKAFAQREMVERFLHGVDPAYDRYVQNRLEDAMKNFASVIFQKQGCKEDEAQNKVEELSPIIAQIKRKFAEKSGEHKETEFKFNILNMVQFMPNQELATLAESLVDLTSLKRRMSAERETVGGEIDVAIISKAEGFVWIKRKHYFPPELNPRFFYRHYKNGEGPDERTRQKDRSRSGLETD